MDALMREYSAYYAYIYTYGCAPDMSEQEWAVYVAKVGADAREMLGHLPEGLRVHSLRSSSSGDLARGHHSRLPHRHGRLAADGLA